MQIGRVSQSTGLSVGTIRFYESRASYRCLGGYVAFGIIWRSFPELFGVVL
jgi:hypothetical protein